MADKKITELTNITGANLADADEFVVVDSSASETKAITYGELKKINGNLNFADNGKAIFGAGSDLQIYHDGSNSHFVENGTGNLVVRGTNISFANSAWTENYATFVENGAVTLYYDNAAKLATTSTGVDVTGTVMASDSVQIDSGGTGFFVGGGATGTTAIGKLHNSSGLLTLDTDSTRSIKLATGTTQRMRIDGSTGDIQFFEDTGTTAKLTWDASAERLGIGTSSPDAELHVEDATGNAVVQIESSATGFSGIFLGDVNDGDVGQIRYDHSDNSMRFGTNAVAERLRIDASGNVGIGTSSPTSLLAVKKDQGADTAIEVSNLGTVGANTTASFIVSETAGSPAGWFRRYRDGTARTNIGYKTNLTFSSDIDTTPVERMRIDSSGRVGINTSSPSQTLDVNGTVHVASHYATSGDSFVYSYNGAAYGAVRSGIHFSGSTNNMVFYTGQNEVARIDSSGNVGIGTSSPNARLEVTQSGEAASLRISNPTSTGFSTVELGDGITTRGQIWAGNASYASFGGASSLNYSANSGPHVWYTNYTEKMRLDASGNLGLGVVPSAWGGSWKAAQIGSYSAIVAGTTSTLIAQNTFHNGTNWLYRNTAPAQLLSQENDGSTRFYTAPSGTAGNAITFTQAMTLDASGNLLVGTTTAYSVSKTTIDYSSNGAFGITLRDTGTATDGAMAYFVKGGAVVGSIISTTSATSYNTSSDYRLKEDVQPMTGASSRVLALNPVNFAWKADGSRTDGFIAHEVQEVAPYAVTGEKDGEDMQAMDHSKLVPLLTAALQEALGRIETLEAEVAALKA